MMNYWLFPRRYAVDQLSEKIDATRNSSLPAFSRALFVRVGALGVRAFAAAGGRLLNVDGRRLCSGSRF